MVSTLSSMKRTSGSTSGFQTSSSPPSFRNLIINGDMAIAQRGTSFANPANEDYWVDRYKYGKITTGVITVTQDTDAPTPAEAGIDFKFSLKVDVTTADASIASGDLSDIKHSIEGFDVAHLGFGTADAATFTLSFWVKSPKTGTHSVSFQNVGQDRSCPVAYTVDAADTWEKKTITVDGDTTGTWGTTNGVGLSVIWCLAAGSTFLNTSGVWAAGNYFGATGQVNCLDNTANNFYITGVQLEVGSSATDFEHVPWDYQLRRCQRYYTTPHVYGTVPADGTYNSAIIGKPAAAGTIEPAANWYFPVTMRGSPTITTYNIGSGTASQWSNGSGTVSANIRVVMRSNTMAVIDNTGVALSAGTQYYVNVKADAEL